MEKERLLKIGKKSLIPVVFTTHHRAGCIGALLASIPIQRAFAPGGFFRATISAFLRRHDRDNAARGLW
jgi:hypothetical protein